MRGSETKFLLVFSQNEVDFRNVCVVFENLFPGSYNYVYVRDSSDPKGITSFDYIFCGKWSSAAIKKYYIRYLEKGVRCRIFDLEFKQGFLCSQKLQDWVDRRMLYKKQGIEFRAEIRKRPLKRCISL